MAWRDNLHLTRTIGGHSDERTAAIRRDSISEQPVVGSHDRESPTVLSPVHKPHFRLRSATEVAEVVGQGKNKGVVVTAVGRELLGFIWAIGIKVETAQKESLQRA